MSATRVLILFVAAAMLQACAAPENTGDAEQSVALFHDRLSSESYREIWDLTAPAFRQTEVHDQALSLFSAMHRRLGPVVASEQLDASFYAPASEGPSVTLIYRTIFEKGTATEIFVFMLYSGKPLIWNYNISSDALGAGDSADLQGSVETPAAL